MSPFPGILNKTLYVLQEYMDCRVSHGVTITQYGGNHEKWKSLEGEGKIGLMVNFFVPHEV